MPLPNLETFQRYLESHARPVDLAFFRYHFFDGTAASVLTELQTFQNDDGGFGHAIEPDMRLPQSTALATWMAFQHIKYLDIDSAEPIVRQALQYFVDTYDPHRSGWAIVRPEVDAHPHAPWWTYQKAMSHFGWGNPSAEILSFFIKYGGDMPVGDIIDALKAKALVRVTEVDPSSFHEVFNFVALYACASDEFRKQLVDPLTALIKNAASTDVTEWSGYVATPLKFIESPSDSFFELFEEQLIQKNLDFLESQIIDGDHWQPNWDWSGDYPEDWARAKQEWSGYLTVKNLLILKRFGRIG